MPERSDAEARVVPTIAVVCLALALVVVVPSGLFVVGWPGLATILFAVMIFLWPVLALLSAWALRRHRR
jgi:hypothetical protein